MFLRLSLLIVAFCTLSCAKAADYSYKEDLQRSDKYKEKIALFIEEMNAKHGFDRAYLHSLFDSVAPLSISKSITSKDVEGIGPANWQTYRDKMINGYRTQQGVLYYEENKMALLNAEKIYGVPPHIIVGIIGIETNYGRIRMPYKAIDALATLSFISTRRGDYFKQELESFLLLSLKEDFEATTIMGSYAGAIGIPQFMPSNIKRYGADGDNDGVVDIINSHADAIFSAANYLAKHGWKRNEPVSVKVAFKGKMSMIDNYVNDSACGGSKITLDTLTKVGFIIPAMNMDKDSGVRLYKVFIGGDNYEYHIAFDNLCVIMKYNQSLRYAMAVNYLGVSIANMGGIPTTIADQSKTFTPKPTKNIKKAVIKKRTKSSTATKQK